MTRDLAVVVVVAAYNAERFLDATLDSLVAQSATDWRCVVVDDGSTDSTARIAARRAETDGRFTVVRQVNGGVSRARNAGTPDAPDALVMFLDSDDLLLPDALESLVAALGNRPDAVAAYGLAEYVDADGRPVRPGEHPAKQRNRRRLVGRRLVAIGPGEDTDFAVLSVAGPVWPPAAALFRVSAVRAVGGFDPSLPVQEDWELCLRLSRQGPFVALDRQVAWYRQHGSGLTGDYFLNIYHQDRVRRMTWESPLNTPEQRRLLSGSARALHRMGLLNFAVLGKRALLARDAVAAAKAAAGFGVLGANLLVPGPPRPSRRIVRFTRRVQDVAVAPAVGEVHQ